MSFNSCRILQVGILKCALQPFLGRLHVAGVATDLVGQGPLMTRNNLMLGDIPIRKAPG